MAETIEKKGILLESGTNEVEIMNFVLGTQNFGINVAKVKTLQKFDPELVVHLPNNSPDSPLRGYYYFRDRTIPLLDLAMAVKMKSPKELSQRLALITEFNGSTNAFIIDDLNRIHRGSWNDISSIPPAAAAYTSIVTGSIRIGNQDVLLLDLEDIISKIFPNTAIKSDAGAQLAAEKMQARSKVRIMISEDSVTIRKLITKVLCDAGYNRIVVHQDGQSAYDELKTVKSEGGERGLSSNLDVIITDIEMPRMDGLTLCKKIRQELQEKTIPVLMFSSLINEQMAFKCREVGATDYITKPRIDELIAMVDRYGPLGKNAKLESMAA